MPQINNNSNQEQKDKSPEQVQNGIQNLNQQPPNQEEEDSMNLYFNDKVEEDGTDSFFNDMVNTEDDPSVSEFLNTDE